MADRYDALKLENQISLRLRQGDRKSPYLDELDLAYTQYIKKRSNAHIDQPIKRDNAKKLINL